MSKKGGSKGKKAIITILVVLVALVAIVFIGARIYFRAPVSDYYKASEKAFAIPGLGSNLVPQGFDYLEDEDLYLVGGYQKDGSPSRIYKVDSKSGKSQGYVCMGDETGVGIAPHAGGLAANGRFVYVAGDEEAFVYVYRLEDVLNAADGEIITSIGKFYTTYGGGGIRADFMCFADGYFFVGEFYKEPNYPTPDTHVFEWETGDENHALMLCYRLGDGENSKFGIETKPANAFSIPDMVQGVAVKDNKIWLSQSYATQISTISCYNLFDTTSGKHVDLESEGSIDVYALNSATFVCSFDAPPMAEEIVFVDGQMLIMSESASNKYFFGNLTGGRWCYATDIDDLT